MTVQQLIDTLQQEDPNAEIAIAYNYGDYTRTTVTPDVIEVMEVPVKYSAYHRMNRLATDDEGLDYNDQDTSLPEDKKVLARVVLSSTYLQM